VASDIVIQLRQLAATLECGHGRSTATGASTEIERLRAEVEGLHANNGHLRQSIGRDGDTIDMLRAKVAVVLPWAEAAGDEWVETAVGDRRHAAVDLLARIESDEFGEGPK
jgi:hypothetical protein